VVFTPIRASYTIQALPRNVKTITVAAANNSKTVPYRAWGVDPLAIGEFWATQIVPAVRSRNMRRFALLAIRLAAAGLFAGCGAVPSTPLPPNADYARIRSVKAVRLSRVPDGLEVTATGKTSSAGWLAPRLVPVTPVQNGEIYRLNFVATPPNGPAAQVITPQSASYTIRPLPTNVKSVSVIAAKDRTTVSIY
jgi:hypothetical protein